MSPSSGPPVQLGPYRIVEKVGEGGMGEVYKARDTQLDRDVALKVLPDVFAADHERLHRFEREAKALAALNHPNIAQVFGIVAAEGRAPAIAMEFVDGRSLDAVKGAMPVDEVLPLARQIAAALEAAHDSGIVHRDLKPGNIKVKDDGTVKVLDFGLAKAVDPTTAGRDGSASPTITSPATGFGVILGTAAYMSPEQARGRAVDRRADIWAFGVVVFELLTGARLFEGETVSDTMAAVLRQEIPWDRLPPAAPLRLQRLLRHCLERDPRSRLKDAGDARIEIDDLIAARGGDESPTVVAAPQRSLERVAWGALVVAGAALAWWLGASRPAQDREVWAQFTQLTDDAGRETMPAISPDGDSIAYASDTSGSWDIYVRRIGGRNATRVTSDAVRNEGAPAFSPDGRAVAFHEADSEGGIFVVGASGESERRMTDAGFHPAWSPDGRSIAFCQERILDPRSRVVVSALSVVDVASGVVRVVTKGDAVQPAWSPSGSRLAYWGQTGGQRDLFTIAAAGGEPVKVTDDAALDWSVTWAPDGRHLYFASDRGGAMNLWRIPIDEASGRARGTAEPVTAGVQASATMPSFSKDGRKLVFASMVTATNPVALTFDPGPERVGEPRYVLRQSGSFVPTSVSPDGSLLALGVIDRQEDVWIGRVDGTNLRRLTDDPHRDRVAVWSPDGREIAFYSNRSGKYEIWTIRADGSGLRQVSAHPGAESLWYPFYDPTANRLWASVSTTRAPVTLSLNDKLPQPGTMLPPIEVEGGVFRTYRITPDGTRLAGVATSDDGSRFAVGWHVIATGETWVVREEGEFGVPAVLDDQRLVFAQGRYLVMVDTAKRRRIIGGPFEFDINGAIPPAVTKDGRTIYVGAVSTESDVWMVERATAAERR